MNRVLLFLCLAGLASAADLKLKDGRILRNYALLELSATEAVIRHSEAIEGVPVALLPADMPRVITAWKREPAKGPDLKADAAKRAARLAELRRIEGVIVERRGTVLRVDCVAPLPPARPEVDSLARRGLVVGPANGAGVTPAASRDPMLDVAPVYGKVLLKGVTDAQHYRLGDRVKVVAERTGDSAEFGWLLPAYIATSLPD